MRSVRDLTPLAEVLDSGASRGNSGAARLSRESVRQVRIEQPGGVVLLLKRNEPCPCLRGKALTHAIRCHGKIRLTYVATFTKWFQRSQHGVHPAEIARILCRIVPNCI